MMANRGRSSGLTTTIGAQYSHIHKVLTLSGTRKGEACGKTHINLPCLKYEAVCTIPKRNYIADASEQETG
jgi:hypothetical protein